MKFRVERSGLVAVRAIRAAQGICSKSPMVLQWLVALGKSKLQLRCGFSVFGFQCIAGVRDRTAESDTGQRRAKGKSYQNVVGFLWSAPARRSFGIVRKKVALTAPREESRLHEERAQYSTSIARSADFTRSDEGYVGVHRLDGALVSSERK